MYDFAADGTVRFSPGAIVSTQYRVEGERLTFVPFDGTVYAIKWNDDDHMRLTVTGTGSEDYTRLGVSKDTRNKLAGEWTGTREMDGRKVLVRWIFGDDSNASLMIRFLTEKGNYTVQNGRLVATFGGQVGLDGTISLTDGILSINRSRGRMTKLSRY